MKPLFSIVKLRRISWSGSEPVPGDVLRTKTGRQYEIQEVVGNKLTCMIIPAEAKPAEGFRVIPWYWKSRKRK